MQKYLIIVAATEWTVERRFTVEGDKVERDGYHWIITRPGQDEYKDRIVTYAGDADAIVACEFVDSEE